MAMIERVNNVLCVGYFLRRNNNNMIMTEVLYVSNWYVKLDFLWGSDILKVFPYEGGVEEPWSFDHKKRWAGLKALHFNSKLFISSS